MLCGEYVKTWSMRVVVFSVVLVGMDINCFKEYEYPKSKYSFARLGNDFSCDFCPFFQKYFHHYEEGWCWNLLRDNILAFLKYYIL